LFNEGAGPSYDFTEHFTIGSWILFRAENGYSDFGRVRFTNMATVCVVSTNKLEVASLIR
jgi:hypothetical protein